MAMSRKKRIGTVIVVAAALLLVPLAVALCRCELFSSNAEAGTAQGSGDRKHCPEFAKKTFPCSAGYHAEKAKAAGEDAHPCGKKASGEKAHGGVTHPCGKKACGEKAQKCEHGSDTCCQLKDRPAAEVDASGEKVPAVSPRHGGLLKPSGGDSTATPGKPACPYATGKEKQSFRSSPLYILHSSFLS